MPAGSANFSNAAVTKVRPTGPLGFVLAEFELLRTLTEGLSPELVSFFEFLFKFG